ncbi:SDR family oxidoreductase [Nonomuraea basaltis]|uniref:SDR family oxidoreductase n=1 Tax=Nonomuraea basaltis TaxID=2495887 RepID=UPI00110C4A1C|nr:NAD(P)H-binding protein [Nonomuraea basaltis]TMR96421.1 NAD-dependent epimerase/dehydratase family protein [Nonomuraea basaltis]
MRILVTGATGTLGGALVPALVKAGHQVRALSRTKRESRGNVEWVWGDLCSGNGLPEAVRGVDAVAHLATSGRRGRGAVDIPGTRLLIVAAREAGVGHLLLTSVVGADRAPIGYLRYKLEAERLVGESGLGWTVLRATPFHQWLDRRLHDFAGLPALPVDPTVIWQPVHTGEVAARAAALLAAGPLGTDVEFGGPEVIGTDELAKAWLRARNQRRPCLRVRYPGRLYAAQRAGDLTTDATPKGKITWQEYLTPPAPIVSDDFASEHTASPTSPATQPEQDPDLHVYGGDEGYERPTRG